MKHASIAAAAVLLAPVLALASDGPPSLLGRLHTDSEARAELADLVHLRGASSEVTSFAATLAADQRKVDEAVLEYAKQNGVTLEPIEKDAEIGRISALQGNKLDHAFLAWVSDSSAALTRQLEKAQGQGDPAFRRVVNHALSCYRDQRSRADRLLREVPST